jgi:hypothetical protein
MDTIYHFAIFLHLSQPIKSEYNKPNELVYEKFRDSFVCQQFRATSLDSTKKNYKLILFKYIL